MRRTFLFRMVAGGAALAFAANRGLAADSEGILGNWHLLAMGDDEVNIPRHRTDLRFWSESGELKGAILSRRNDGAEFPLASASFDGSTLRFKMMAANGRTEADMPTMVMTRNGGRLEGYWRDAEGTAGPPLKLVRAR